MTVVDRVASPADRSSITKMSLAGAICYAIWGCLHIYAVYNVFMLGDSVDPGMVRGRLHQGGWNLFFFGVTAIGVALALNIRNSNGHSGAGGHGLDLLCPDTRYWSWWPGLAGPILWVAG